MHGGVAGRVGVVRGNGVEMARRGTWKGAGNDPGPHMYPSVTASLTVRVIFRNVHDCTIDMGQQIIRNFVTLCCVEKTQRVNCAKELRRIGCKKVFHYLHPFPKVDRAQHHCRAR